MSNIDRIAQILRDRLPLHLTAGGYVGVPELAAEIVAELQPRPGTVLADLVARACHAIEWGNSDSLHRELLEQVEFLDHEFEAERDRANEHFDARMTAETRVRELQPRTVETVEQLDALPPGSVIRGKTSSYERFADGHWWRPAAMLPVSPSALHVLALPARVLYTPGADHG